MGGLVLVKLTNPTDVSQLIQYCINHIVVGSFLNIPVGYWKDPVMSGTYGYIAMEVMRACAARSKVQASNCRRRNLRIFMTGFPVLHPMQNREDKDDKEEQTGFGSSHFLFRIEFVEGQVGVALQRFVFGVFECL